MYKSAHFSCRFRGGGGTRGRGTQCAHFSCERARAEAAAARGGRREGRVHGAVRRVGRRPAWRSERARFWETMYSGRRFWGESDAEAAEAAAVEAAAIVDAAAEHPENDASDASADDADDGEAALWKLDSLTDEGHAAPSHKQPRTTNSHKQPRTTQAANRGFPEVPAAAGSDDVDHGARRLERPGA